MSTGKMEVLLVVGKLDVDRVTEIELIKIGDMSGKDG